MRAMWMVLGLLSLSVVVGLGGCAEAGKGGPVDTGSGAPAAGMRQPGSAAPADAAAPVAGAAVDPLAEGTFTLYSLEPAEGTVAADNGTFHGWVVLGSMDVPALETRQMLMKALEDGRAENKNVSIDCFEPRHGISITRDHQVTDYVICFTCRQVKVFVDGVAAKERDYLTSETPRKLFNTTLSGKKVRLAQQPEAQAQ